MKANRFIGGIGIAFHSMAEVISASVIIRLVIEVIYMQILPDISRNDYIGDLGDKFTPLLLLTAGLLSCVRYNRLCASVNLSPFKRFSAVCFLGLVTAAAFAFFDIFIVKEFYFIVSPREIAYLWTESIGDYWKYGFDNMFSPEGAYFFVKLMLFYHVVFLTGYCTAHILSGERSSWRLFVIYIEVIPALVLALIIAGAVGHYTAMTAMEYLIQICFATSPIGIVFLLAIAFDTPNRICDLTLLIALTYAGNVCYTALFSMLIKPKIKRLRPKR